MSKLHKLIITLALAATLVSAAGCSQNARSGTGTAPPGPTATGTGPKPPSPTSAATVPANPTPLVTASALPTTTVGAEATATPQIAPTGAIGSESDTLVTGMRFAPPDTTSLAYTNWALIKQYIGLPDLTSKSALDERQKLWMSTSQGQAAGSAVFVSYATRMPDVWGFGLADLDWEATITTSKQGPPAYVLRFRDSFDLTPVVVRFRKRGFSEQSYRGVSVYSHGLTMSAKWLQDAFVPGMLNTAVLPNEHLLVLSSDPNRLRQALNAYMDDASLYTMDRSASDVVSRLGTVGAAFLMPGHGTCGGLSPRTVGPRNASPQAVAQYQGRLEAFGSVHPYDALGIGYRYESGRPVGLIVMHYGDPKAARQDLSVRRKLASRGISLVTNSPINQALFRVRSARVEGSDLVLRVAPVGGAPSRLFQAVFQNDLLFAACPSGS